MAYRDGLNNTLWANMAALEGTLHSPAADGSRAAGYNSVGRNQSDPMHGKCMGIMARFVTLSGYVIVNITHSVYLRCLSTIFNLP